MFLMTQWIATIVGSDMVLERHYFLEVLHTPQIIVGIRVTFMIGCTAALVIYKKMKDKNGE